MARRIFARLIFTGVFLSLTGFSGNARAEADNPAASQGEAPAVTPEDEGLVPEFKLFARAIGAVHEAYVGDVKPRQLLYEAVKGMLASLGDKYSQFIDPQLYELLKIHMSGAYAGIGAVLEMVGDFPAIRDIKPESAAHKAGLLPGDKILKIDGVSMEKKAIPEVAKLLRGEADTAVKLTLERFTVPQPFEVSVPREKIVIESVQDAKMITQTIAYLRIAAFSENTGTQVRRALKDLTGKGMKSLILDLRNNDGGLLPQAVKLAGFFLPPKQKVVNVTSKLVEQRKEHFTAGKYRVTEDLRLIILVNHVTASASEIFSACMQDHKRARILGTQTFGKASVQSVVPLDDASAMKLTTARYLSPSGRAIDGVGIAPDEAVEEIPEGGGLDQALLRAIAILTETGQS